ncbi:MULTISPECIES: TrkH family potassium uptake protein [Synechocystis]|uniref:TrkH family potassium uptake protein n=1 Tax=Synechocystis salina LEGE 00031 TaxID=1828736 RepID=A0ABR9VUA9_9SYNC|nr:MULTISPECIES: TrkH family potassium uptake protein [Synechocystis]MBD2654650.1 ATPase [Synechocystis sp. FACHB-383]MBE9241576.1 TrkH family potassium uptake protein [Synechocystis salina LEGE 00041]MBE9254950.1 TrkH family potassium uptake protein [Synechocystis salina LEGE 00031]
MTISRTICLGFIAAIAGGALLLLMPFATSTGEWGSPLVALFTSTSAVCVTGLSVVDVSKYFSFWGELTVMLLAQLGGLGYMTLTTFLMILIGRKFDLQQRFAIQESFDHRFAQGSNNLIKSVIATTLIFEITGAIILFGVFVQDYPPIRALWYAVFHSISAFNNAGFSLFSDGLIGYQSSLPLNLAVSALIIFGGIGYQVIIEAYFWVVRKVKNSQRRFAFSLNLRVVVRVTIFLLLLGFFGILILEAQGNRALAQFSLQDRLLIAWFQSVTTRTAGFNTIDLNDLSSTSLVLVMLLMFIGASPSGTGGGIKTTTFAILANCTRSALRGQERVIIHGRCIPPQLILKAIAVVFGSVMTVISSVSLLVFLESGQETVALAFEAVSAFATVGLSLGITPELKPLSQLVLIVTMFIGRVGITILMAAIVGDPKPSLIKYPEENLLVG